MRSRNRPTRREAKDAAPISKAAEVTFGVSTFQIFVIILNIYGYDITTLNVHHVYHVDHVYHVYNVYNEL